MTQIPERYWFKSDRFEVEPGEDEDTNPRRYGKQPAAWLREKFLEIGYEVEDLIPEDWGWCVMCSRDPFSLWVGCSNLPDYEHAREGDPPPPNDKLLWAVFPTAEIPFFRYLFRKKPDVSADLEKLRNELLSILESEPGVTIVDESTADAWFDA